MESVVNDNYGAGEKEALKDVEAANIEMTELDDSKAHFIPKDDKDLDNIEVRVKSPKKEDSAEFTGLTKEELMEYANNPFWTKLRLALFILFWVGWIAMLAAAIIIIVLAPRCPPKPDLKWWHEEVVYQVYPQSFQDSTKGDDDKPNARYDDGFGDIKGFESRLSYLEDLKTNVVWMNSMYKFDDFGIVNHTEISPRFGTISEVKKLVKKMHKKGMKLVFDFIPNHTSKNHTWFLKSQKKDGKYADYYVWQPCDDDAAKAPSNWKSVTGDKSGGAWKKDDVRGECYYHAFMESQPDLNLRNADVLKELEDVLVYWADLGIDGFHVNDAAYLVEADPPKDEDKAADAKGDDYASFSHDLTMHQSETYLLMQNWTEIITRFSKPEREKLLFTTMNEDVNTTLPYYGTEERPGVHFIPSQVLYNLKSDCNAACFQQMVSDVLADQPDNATGGWRLDDENNARFASLIDPSNIKALHTLHLLLPGAVINYYGDEIGLKDAPIADFNDVQDPLGKAAGKDKYRSVYRDQYRTPMRWNAEEGAGFTKGTPWLPITGDQPTVQEHAAKFAQDSPIEVFKQLTALRREPAFRWGLTKWSVNNDNLLSFVRVAEGYPAYLVAINFGNETTTPKFTSIPEDTFTDKMEVVMHSSRQIEEGDMSFNPKDTAVAIQPGDAIVFKFEVEKEE